MARRTLDRKALRQQVEAAEALQGEAKSQKAPSRARRAKAKVKKETKLVALWGVFNQALVEVQTFDYSRRADAEKLAKELSESKKVPHFVQLVKRQVEIEIPSEG